MSTKLQIKGSTDLIELPRGAVVPKEGDILHITPRRSKDEKTYTVYTVEHTFDFNLAFTVGQTLITLEEVKQRKPKAKSEE